MIKAALIVSAMNGLVFLAFSLASAIDKVRGMRILAQRMRDHAEAAHVMRESLLRTYGKV